MDNHNLPRHLKEKVQNRKKMKSRSVELVRKEKSGPSGISCDPLPQTTLSLLKHIEKYVLGQCVILNIFVISVLCIFIYFVYFRQRAFSGVCEQLELLSSKDGTMVSLI